MQRNTILPLKQELIELAASSGAINARIASIQMLKNSPFSDSSYLHPDDVSVIIHTVSSRKDCLSDYFGKEEVSSEGLSPFFAWKFDDSWEGYLVLCRMLAHLLFRL